MIQDWWTAHRFELLIEGIAVVVTMLVTLAVAIFCNWPRRKK